MLKKEQVAQLRDMGFSKEDIEKAAKVASQKGVDIIDVLTKAATNTHPTNSTRPPSAQQPSATQTNSTRPPSAQQRQVQPFQYRPLVKPRDQINLDEYDVIYRDNDQTNFMGQEDQREQGMPMALKNVSNCCYLNSLLQMFFLMPRFVEIVLKANPISKEQLDIVVPNSIRNKRIFNSFSLLKSLQNLFSGMILSTRRCLDPSDILRNLVDSLGNKISYGEEKDLSEISLQFISRLQECVIYTQQNLSDLHEHSQSPEKEREGFMSTIGTKSIQSPIKQLLFGDKAQLTNDAEDSKIESKFFGILLNPVHGSLYKALEEQFHYRVEQQGRSLCKDVWITKQPEYLFLFIQRTNYDKHVGVIKIKNKIKFDFEIYLDRYLLKNKHKQEQKNPILIGLIQKKYKTTEQIEAAQSLLNALTVCHSSSDKLEEKPVSLPAIQPVKMLIQRLQTELKEIQSNIGKLESREQKYFLKFIIVHRGEADSGHYWGYGYTNNSWWRFDILNSKIERDRMIYEIQNGDVVVYALIYGRRQEAVQPSYNLYLSDDDLMDIGTNYNHFVSEQNRVKILQDNKQREMINEKRKSAEAISVITLQYEERFRVINENVKKYLEKHSKIPLLSNFSTYLRWITGEEPNQHFKAHLLDVAIRNSTKYSIANIPDEDFKNQLMASCKQNLSKYSCPDKAALTKNQHDKLTDRFKEYKNNLFAVAMFQKMFDRIGKGQHSEAIRWSVSIMKLGLRNYLESVAKEYFVVLALCMASNGLKIPRSSLKELEKIDRQLAQLLSNYIQFDDRPSESLQHQAAVEEICRQDKQKDRQLYFWSTEAKMNETTGDKLSEEIRRSMGSLQKYIRMYNRLLSNPLPKRQQLFG